jgi:cytoskeletal protein CcmA (bactofilin family)
MKDLEDVIEVKKGEQVNKDIILVAKKNHYSCLKIEGRVIGNVFIYRESTIDGGPTDTNVEILPEGILDGDIYNVDRVDIAGACSGDIKASIITIRKGAVVRGNINCMILYGDDFKAVQDGAFYYKKVAIK